VVVDELIVWTVTTDLDLPSADRIVDADEVTFGAETVRVTLALYSAGGEFTSDPLPNPSAGVVPADGGDATSALPLAPRAAAGAAAEPVAVVEPVALRPVRSKCPRNSD
jgi:hypothetical protein